MKRIVLMIVSVAGLAALASAQPPYMNYQGRLLDSAGDPLANGSYTLEFYIYGSPNGSDIEWGPFLCDDGSGDGHAARAIIANGRFNVILGPDDTAGRPLVDAFQGDGRFVQITVDGGAPILPRQQVLSAPYALQSHRAETADVAESLVQELADALCPPGSILAFGGTSVPSGWLLCDGQIAASADYPDLHAAIGTAWGDGTYDADGNVETPANPDTNFNLPDLRGVFLRGVSGVRDDDYPDPGRDSRVASQEGGSAGNNVGSLQDQELRVHNHRWAVMKGIGRYSWVNSWTDKYSSTAEQIMRGRTAGDAGGSGDDDAFDVPRGEAFSAYTDPVSTTEQSSGETRPTNVYVHYIIKY